MSPPPPPGAYRITASSVSPFLASVGVERRTDWAQKSGQKEFMMSALEELSVVRVGRRLADNNFDGQQMAVSQLTFG